MIWVGGTGQDIKEGSTKDNEDDLNEYWTKDMLMQHNNETIDATVPGLRVVLVACRYTDAV